MGRRFHEISWKWYSTPAPHLSCAAYKGQTYTIWSSNSSCLLSFDQNGAIKTMLNKSHILYVSSYCVDSSGHVIEDRQLLHVSCIEDRHLLYVSYIEYKHSLHVSIEDRHSRYASSKKKNYVDLSGHVLQITYAVLYPWCWSKLDKIYIH